MIQSIALNVACCMTRNVWYKSAEEKKKKLRKSFNGFSFFYLRFIVRNYSVASQMLPPPHYVNAVAQVLLSSFFVVSDGDCHSGGVRSVGASYVRRESINSIDLHQQHLSPLTSIEQNTRVLTLAEQIIAAIPDRIKVRIAGPATSTICIGSFFSIKMSCVFSL